VTWIAFSPDGKTLATADSNSNSTYLWNVSEAGSV
jgi:WD40 repeat protein